MWIEWSTETVKADSMVYLFSFRVSKYYNENERWESILKIKNLEKFRLFLYA